jgi:hypothetical protein
MAANELLGTYLNDHLSGSVSGVQLAERLRSDHEGTPLATTLRALVHDIEEDRATLVDLMERLGIEPSAVKQAVGWGVEKLSRLKMNQQLTGSPELTRLLQTETLSLGIEGKLAMWRSLKEAAATDARLAGTDFDRLVDRARQQRETLEPHRLEAAAKAFSS